jgi:CRISPR-associated protein Cas2
VSDFYVICFDVRDAKRLRKVSDTLENFGVRVQRSVFECHLEAAQLAALQRRIGGLIAAAEDHVRYYALCPKDCAGVTVDGDGDVSVDPDYHIL